MSEKQATTVDIAITCYNTARYINDCLQSIIEQTYKNWTLVIVDDGSRDNTVDVIRSFIKKHRISKKCKLYSIENNCGYGRALKTAIEYGDGELIFIVDSDDALDNIKAIEIMVNEHKKHPEVSMMYSNYFDCDENLRSKSLKVCRNLRPGETYLGKFVNNKFSGIHSTISHLKSFKRTSYELTEGLNPNIMKAVDKDLILKLEEVGSLLHIPENLYLHRKHSKSISNNFKNLNSVERARIMEMKNKMYVDANNRRMKNENIT